VSDFSDEFIAGQIACREGKECPVDATEPFQRGYAAEYEKEQQQTELGVNHAR